MAVQTARVPFVREVAVAGDFVLVGGFSAWFLSRAIADLPGGLEGLLARGDFPGDGDLVFNPAALTLEESVGLGAGGAERDDDLEGRRGLTMIRAVFARGDSRTRTISASSPIVNRRGSRSRRPFTLGRRT